MRAPASLSRHITCDAHSASAIVVPAFAAGGELIAVPDIDSDRPAAFDDEDRVRLERLVEWSAAHTAVESSYSMAHPSRS